MIERVRALGTPALLIASVALAGCTVTRKTTATPDTAESTRRTAAAAPVAAGPPQAQVELTGELPLDPSFTRGKLDNGLTYFIKPNRKPENRAAIWLAVNAGAIQEDDDQQGLAHFVEHMAFNGTKNFAKQEIIDYLETIGMRFGPDVNAFTSFDETVYMLEVPTDDGEIVETAFRILKDWAGAVAFEDEEIDKERGVVMEEWRLGRGAGARIRDKILPVIFKDSRYALRLPIGKKEILENAPYDAFRRFYRDWYRPDLMAVIAVGDFDPGEIEGKIAEHFSGLRNPEGERPREVYPVPEHEETLFTMATDPEATSTSVSVYYKLDKRPDHRAQDYRRSVVEQLYHGMINSRLNEIRQQPDPPFVFASSSSGAFVRSRDVYYQSAGVKEGEVERGLEALLTEVERVDRHGFNASELEREKTDMLRGYEQAYRERDKRRSQSIASETMRHFLNGEPMPGIAHELAMVEEFLPGITLEEVNDLAKEWITESNRVIAVSGPEKEGVSLPDEGELLAVFRALSNKKLEPYVDDVIEGPLVAEKPRPGRIVSEERIPEIDTTVWRLSNGIRVVLKPTDFKNDEIRLAGISPGGHSLVPDEKHVSARYSTSLMRAGGLGTFDSVQLDKALAGKVASAGAYVGELEEGINASCSPDDVETMFQLLYLKMTAPRLDEEAIAAWFDRTRTYLENRNARPENVFRDRMSEVMSGDHFRRRPATVERLDEIDVASAYDIYRDRFADAGDFQFFIVGNFDLETIRPYVMTYLGGLPSTGREETWRDVGVEAPDGRIEFDVKKGLEPKSRVTIRFTGDAKWSRQASHDLRSLASALRIRLREVLREDMGGTYGVSVSGGISRRPKQRFGFTVSFGCAPENVEDLTAAVFEQIELLKTDGVDDDVVTKVKEAQTRSRETDLKENRFWLDALESYFRYGDDPRLILDYDDLVDGVSAEKLQATAQRMLDTERTVIGTLYPEEGVEQAEAR